MADTEPLFLGVDGGGTGCRARLETGDGAVLGEGLAGPATTRIGIDEAWAAVQAASDRAISEADLSTNQVRRIHAGVGLAGIGRIGAQDQLESLPHSFASIVFLGDGPAACLGAHGGRDGGIVIAGTGSIGVARIAGETVQVGGYGFPIADEGSGAYLGLTAIRLALRAHDGRRERTALLHDVLIRFGQDPNEAVAWMDHATATDYATLAPLVVRHAGQGDAAARQIMQRAAQHIDGLIRALMARGAERIALLGGLSSALEPWLAPDVRFRLKPAKGDAVDGAIIAAKRATARAE